MSKSSTVQAAANSSSSIALSNDAQSAIVFISLLLMAIGGLIAYYGQNTTLGEVLAIIGVLAISFKQFAGSSSAPTPTGLTNAQQALITFVGLLLYAVGTVAAPIGAPVWIGFVLHLSGAVALAIKEYLGTWSNPTNLPNAAQGIITFGAMFALGAGQIIQAQVPTAWPYVLGFALVTAISMTLQEWISPPTASVMVAGQSVAVPESAPPS